MGSRPHSPATDEADSLTEPLRYLLPSRTSKPPPEASDTHASYSYSPSYSALSHSQFTLSSTLALTANSQHELLRSVNSQRHQRRGALDRHWRVRLGADVADCLHFAVTRVVN